MSALNLRLPDSIHRHIREIAKKEGVSINQFISSALSEKISALLNEKNNLQMIDKGLYYLIFAVSS
ncbi:MAG: toxin-antitoxin system HicB family antitoxin [Nitrospirota bacterium]